MEFSDAILTALTVITGILAICTYMSHKRKDGRTDGQNEGSIASDIKYIKEMLGDIKTDVSKLTNSINEHSKDITEIKTDLKNTKERLADAFKLIEDLQDKLDDEERKNK